MNSNDELDLWLSGFGVDPNPIDPNDWDPGFDAERRVVHSRFVGFDRLYLRPEGFRKRFYHHVYPLTIASWTIKQQSKLYGGFCLIDAGLDIRFQATLQYASANREFLGDLNGHIIRSYEGLICDVLDKELLNLTETEWLDSGLRPAEKKLAAAINELLVVQNVQCRTFCSLKPIFQEFPDDAALDARFAQESVYLKVIKKNFEFREKQQQEKQRQEQELEQKKLAHQQSQLQLIDREGEIERLKTRHEAENFQLLLKDKEEQQAEQFKLESRLHQEKIKHQTQLQELEWLAELALEEKRQAQKREDERQRQQEKTAYELDLKQQQLAANIEQFEQEQAAWNETKERLHLENLKLSERLKQLDLEAELKALALEQSEREKLQQELHQKKIAHEAQLKAIEINSEVEGQALRYEASKNSDEYLRREIELLILEKQRAELNQQIKKFVDGEKG